MGILGKADVKRERREGEQAKGVEAKSW